MPACLYAIASFYLLPNPAINGLISSGNTYFIFCMMLAFIFPVFFINSFFTAWKNSSGYIKSGPYIPTCSCIYFFENSYKGRDLIVIHTILYPLSETLLMS